MILKKVIGNRRHGEPDADDEGPVGIGAKANAAEPSAISENARVRIGADLRGNQKIVGNIAHDTADRGNPIKVGGVGRTTNPSAIADGDRVNAFFDDLGRSVVTLHQVRDLVTKTTTSLATGTETTIVAAVAATYNDLVLVTCHNDSTVAVTIAFRDVAVGAVVFRMTVPAADSRSLWFNVPLPQTTVNTAWTADMPDITGTIVTILAQAIKNV